MNKNYGFSRKGPDLVAEELAKVLSSKVSYEFKALFLIVHANLKARNAANGGEEMLRLRAHEQLQKLLRAGVVKKTGKEYSGVPAALVAFFDAAAEMKEKLALGIHLRPPLGVQKEVRAGKRVAAKA